MLYDIKKICFFFIVPKGDCLKKDDTNVKRDEVNDVVPSTLWWVYFGHFHLRPKQEILSQKKWPKSTQFISHNYYQKQKNLSRALLRLSLASNVHLVIFKTNNRLR